MKEDVLFFIVVFIIILATFTTITGVSYINSDAFNESIQDSETDAFDTISILTTLSSDLPWLQPLIAIIIVLTVIILALIIRG